MHWVLVASAALLAVAVLVACWEHWRPGPEPLLEAAGQAAARKLSIDIELDKVLDGPAVDDAAQRRQALHGTLDRMAQATSLPAAGWKDTEPMIGPSPRAEPAEPQRASSEPTSASAH